MQKPEAGKIRFIKGTQLPFLTAEETLMMRRAGRERPTGRNRIGQERKKDPGEQNFRKFTILSQVYIFISLKFIRLLRVVFSSQQRRY